MTLENDHDSRIQTTFDYIKANIDRDLSVEHLSKIANMSKYHFHRKFLAHVGINVTKAIRLLRLKRACYQLAFNATESIINIAMDAGFDTPESFSRAFKREMGLSPSLFRKQPDWSVGVLKSPLIFEGREMDREVEIKKFDQTRIAVLEHCGPPSQIYQTAQQFVAWRKKHGLPPSRSRTFNILYDDPETVQADRYRMDICAEIKTSVKENSFGVVEKLLPDGLCAVVRHTGSWDFLGESVRWLYVDWLSQSDYKLGGQPIFVERVNLFPETPEHELITDIYMPVMAA